MYGTFAIEGMTISKDTRSNLWTALATVKPAINKS